MSLTKVQEIVELDELQLLNGSPIYFEDICYIFQPTIRDIANITYKTFREYLYILISDPQVAFNLKEPIDSLTFIVNMSDSNLEFYELLKKAFRFFTHEDILIITEFNGIQIGNNFNKNKMITKENFPKFQYILKKMHWYDSSQVHDNPENERARKIIEKINKGHQLVNQAKKNKNEDTDEIDLPTLVSSLAIRYNSLSEVFDLSYYAFNDQIKRMQYEEEYQTNLRSALAGAKIPKDKMKYWIRKIKNDN